MIFSKHDNISQLFRNLNISKIVDIINYQNSLFLFKFYFNMLPTAFQEFIAQTSTRHECDTTLATGFSWLDPSRPDWLWKIQVVKRVILGT